MKRLIKFLLYVVSIYLISRAWYIYWVKTNERDALFLAIPGAIMLVTAIAWEIYIYFSLSKKLERANKRANLFTIEQETPQKPHRPITETSLYKSIGEVWELFVEKLKYKKFSLTVANIIIVAVAAVVYIVGSIWNFSYYTEVATTLAIGGVMLLSLGFYIKKGIKEFREKQKSLDPKTEKKKLSRELKNDRAIVLLSLILATTNYYTTKNLEESVSILLILSIVLIAANHLYFSVKNMVIEGKQRRKEQEDKLAKDEKNTDNTENKKTTPFVFINKKEETLFESASKWGLLFSRFKRQILDIPLDYIGIVTYGTEAKIVAYFREGGSYIFNPNYHVVSRSNQNIDININNKLVIGEENITGQDFAVGTATAEQSIVYGDDFKKMYSEALSRNNKNKKPTDDEKNTSDEVWKNETKDGKGNYTNVVVTLFPAVTVVLEVATNDDKNWKQNIELFFKNVKGQNEEERMDYLKRQITENVKSVLNEVSKKFTYGQLQALLRIGAISHELKIGLDQLNKDQELGLNIRTIKITALNAPPKVHSAQMEISINQADKIAKEIEAERDRNIAKLKAEADALTIKLTGVEKAGAAREMNNAEIEAAKGLLNVAKEADVDPAKILELENELEKAKQYAQAKGTIIVQAGGGNNNQPAENSNMLLIIQAINNLSEAIAKKV